MTTMNAKRRTPWLDGGPHMISDVPQTAPSPDSFQASLQNIAAQPMVRRETSRLQPSPSSPWVMRHRSRRPTLAERIAAWLRDQWVLSVAKRSQATELALLEPESIPVVQRKQMQLSAGVGGKLLSWVQTKYKMSSTKRLRVAEVASLGDKRFVALVSVEGREFLIGGGASGVSLLTPLRAEEETASAGQRALDVRGAS